MLKKQRNAIYTEILGAGLNPQYFEIVVTEENNYWLEESVVIKNSGMWFRFSQKLEEVDTYDCYFTHPQPGFKYTYGSSGSFNIVLEDFRNWLVVHAKNYIENEIEGVDLWSPVEFFKPVTGPSSVFSASNTKDNTNFTSQEKEHIRSSTQRFRQLVIQNFTPTKEQQEHIDSRLEYLVNAVDRLNRRDWQDVAISTLISIAINLTVDTEKGRILFALFQQAFHHVIKSLPPIG